MSDLRERKTTTATNDNTDTNVTTDTSDKKDTQLDTPGSDHVTSQTTSDNSLDNWNALSYWYYMQSYYQQYSTTCYMYTYYYWQLVASQNNQYGATPMAESLPQREGPRVQVEPVRNEGCDAKISSIQKRVLAELIDFFFLYFTKFVMFTIFYNSMDRYTQLQYSLIIDENTNLKDLEEILIQALVYRFMVFAYEMFFLVGGFYGDLGGATPGKHLVGLSVLAADSVEVIDNNILEGEKVRILPGENPGWWRAGVRALVKNFSMTFLFPVFLTVFFFNNNRTIYDIISGTVVVDKKSQQLTQQRPQQ